MKFIKLFIPPILLIIWHKLQKKILIFESLRKKNIRAETKKYKIGSYEIILPEDHTLPDFQKSHRLYDRFLPFLVKYLSSDKLIIDVGANVGDSTISMMQYCSNSFYCLEPSDLFFPYLEINLKNLSLEDQQRVKFSKYLIGTGKYNGVLSHTGGTASVNVLKSSSVKPNTLDEIIENFSNVALLKVDTDGYDFDVMQSAEKIIIKSKPVLFWENQMLETFQKRGFERFYKFLVKTGYNHIFIFDNFGNLLLEDSDYETLRKLNSYINSLDTDLSTRTIYYLDILATTKSNYDKVKCSINEYKSFIGKTI